MSPDDHPVLFRRAGGVLDRRGVRAFAAVLRQDLTAGKPFTCLITGDSELRRLNRQFLDRDYPADVLSFPSASTRELGEIAISIDRAAEQARQLGHSVDDEVRILMLHGVLHLLGMDHEIDEGSMARIEKRWRKKLGLPEGLIERAGALIKRTP
jgi:probable rRNA maturation factor